MYIEFEKLSYKLKIGDTIIVTKRIHDDFHSKDREIFETIKGKEVTIESIERNDVTRFSSSTRYEGYDLLIKYEGNFYKIHTLNIGDLNVVTEKIANNKYMEENKMNRINSKVVSNKIKEEILNSLEGHIDDATVPVELLQGFYNQIKFTANKGQTIYSVIDQLISGAYAGFEFEYYYVNKFIDSLDIRVNSVVHGSDECWDMYKRLMASNILDLFKQYKIEYRYIF